MIAGADTASLNVWYNGSYYLVAQLASGCQYRSNTITINENGYSNLGRLGQGPDTVRLVPPNEALTIYPNPARSTVTVSTGSLTANGIQVYDSEGRILFSKNLEVPQLIQMDVSTWTSGVYIVSVICDDKKVWQKLVKY